MHSDSSAESRSAKLSKLLAAYEDYITEVVSADHGMKQEEMTRIVNESMQRSMQVNVSYHKDMARIDEGSALSNYHKSMASVYESLVK